jgi:hypothetical protein
MTLGKVRYARGGTKWRNGQWRATPPEGFIGDRPGRSRVDKRGHGGLAEPQPPSRRGTPAADTYSQRRLGSAMNGAYGGVTRPALRTVPDEPDQVPRLNRFREEHPGVAIGAGSGWWQALVPEANGETVVTRYTLRALLDKLDELLSGKPDKAQVPR